MEQGGDLRRRHFLTLLLLLVFLFFCAQWLPHTNGVMRLVGGIIGYACLGSLLLFSGLKWGELGLSRKHVAVGIRWSLIILLAGILFSLSAFLVNPESFRDPRYNQPFGAAFIAAFVLLPLKTVLFEELAFRGLLAGLLDSLKGKWFAITGSAVAFGLWHLPTALGAAGSLRNNQLVLPEYGVLLLVFTTTGIVGGVLAYLRFRSKSLLVPVTLHWVINAIGIILASLAWRH